MTSADKNEAEKDRMDMLEKRIKGIEADCAKEPTTVTGMMCQCGYDIVRSIPFCSMLAIWPSVTGIGLMLAYSQEVAAGAETLDLGTAVEEMTSDLFMVSVFVLVVDVLVFIASFTATGATREYVFGHDQEGALLCFACMVGPCILGLLMVLLFIQFLVLFFAFLVTVPATSLIGLTAGACSSGSEADKTGFALAFADMLGVDAPKISTAIAAICSKPSVAGMKPEGMPYPAQLSVASCAFTLGVALATLGQAWQLVTHMNNWEKVMMQKDLDDEGGKELLNDYYKTHQFQGKEI